MSDISVKYSLKPLGEVGVNREQGLVEITLPERELSSLTPNQARWISTQLWCFAAEADGKHDSWSIRIKQEAYFG